MARKLKGRAVNQDRLAVNLSSGYTAIIRRPTMQTIRMIGTKAEELYPVPEPPTTEITTVTGITYQVADTGDGEKSEAQKAYEKAKAEAENQREMYLLNYVLDKRTEIEEYESDEGRQEIIEAFVDDRAEIEEFGTVPDDLRGLDAWQFTLRVFVIGDGPDHAAVMLAAMKAMDQEGINEAEIRRRVSFL